MSTSVPKVKEFPPRESDETSGDKQSSVSRDTNKGVAVYEGSTS